MQVNGLLLEEVGNRGVKARRRSREVGTGPGGVTADYVPFYFAPRSPMMYAIGAGRVPEYEDGLGPLVYLVSTPERLAESGCQSVISDGNCANAVTEFSSDLTDLDRIVDWEIMAATYWADTNEDGDRRRRRSAEFLVHEHVPPSAIHAMVTRSEATLEQLREILAESDLDIPTSSQPSWYY